MFYQCTLVWGLMPSAFYNMLMVLPLSMFMMHVAFLPETKIFKEHSLKAFTSCKQPFLFLYFKVCTASL